MALRPKRLRSGDFEKLLRDYPEMEELIYNLNETRNETSKSLNSRLSISENLNQELKDITINTSAVIFKTSIIGRPRGVTIVKAEQECTGGFVNWEYLGDSRIKINSITGLTPDCNNKFTLLVIGE